MKRILLFSLLLSFGNISISQWYETDILKESEPTSGGNVGSGVDISGEWAIVGAGENDEYGVNAGAIIFYKNVDGEWVEMQKLVAEEVENGDYFGRYVGIDNHIAVAGSVCDGDFGDCSGATYVFELGDDGVWIETAKLTASDADAEDGFGSDVAIHGEQIIVGAPFNQDAGVRSGSAYIYEKTDGEWVETAKLVSADLDEEDWFGFSVDIEGDRAAVGAWLEGDEAYYGAAYLFEKTEGVWEEVAKIIPSELTGSFSIDIALDANHLAVGAADAVFVYDLSGAEVEEMVMLTASSEFADGFGTSIALDNNRLIVADAADDMIGTNAGAGYVFVLEDDVWVEKTMFFPSDPAIGTGFGEFRNIAIDNDYIFAGATGYDEWLPEIGGVYVYEYCAITPEISSAVSLESFGADGAIDLTVTGGVPDYTFDWDIDEAGDFDDDEDLADLSAGTYTVVVRDEVGCETTETIVVDSQVGIDELSEVVNVYPNPATSNLTIELEGVYTYSIYNLSGALVQQGQGNDTETVNISELPAGAYILQLLSNNQTLQLHLIKQ